MTGDLSIPDASGARHVPGTETELDTTRTRPTEAGL
jgi:hypothetical protein